MGRGFGWLLVPVAAIGLAACSEGGGGDEFLSDLADAADGADPGTGIDDGAEPDRDVPVTPDAIGADPASEIADGTDPGSGTTDGMDSGGDVPVMPDSPGDDAAPELPGEVPSMDASPDAGDARAEAGDEGPADPGVLEIPFVPARPTAPVRDEPYVQETNHTINEVDPALVPLVAVMVPPAGFETADRPLQVTPRGLAWAKEGDAWTFKGPADGEADLVAGAGGPGVVALASPAVLYRVATDGTVTRDLAPEGLTILGLDSLADGGVFLRTDRGAAAVPPAGDMTWPAGGAAVTAVVLIDGLLYAGHPDGTVTLHDFPAAGLPGPEVATLGASDGLLAGPVVGLVAGVTLPTAIDLVVVSEGGMAGLHLTGGGGKVAEPVTAPLFAADRVPLERPSGAAKVYDGGFVVAAAGGAFRVVDRGDGPEWRFYGAERWLPSADVRGVATDAATDLAPLYFATAAGLGTVTAERITLEQKMGPFVSRIVGRHDRDGAVADSHLTRRGDLSSNIPWDSDNDGSWTAYWLMGECARYKVTGDPAAKAHFDKSLAAMLFLRTITGTDWFLARAVIRKEGCILDDCDNPDDGKWYSSADDRWWIKRDTSNDELIGHFSMMAMAYEFCADEAQKEGIRAHMAGILGGLIDHGFQLWDPITMAVTTYGQLDPEYVNEWIGGVYGDGGLRAAILLSGLTATYWMTGDSRFAEAKRLLIEEHGYAVAAETEIDHEVRPLSNDNDEMSSWAWWTLLRYETDPVLRARWERGFSGVYDVKLKMQQAGWWGLARATTGFTDMDVQRDVRRWLRVAPVDMIRWDMHNSHRKDVVRVEEPFDGSGGGMRTDGRPLPYDERRTDRFNTDQYRLDGGMGGTIEMDGAEVLMTYWMSRLFGFLEPAEG